MSFGFSSSGSSGLLSPSFGGLGSGVLDGLSGRDLALPSNAFSPPSSKDIEPEPTVPGNSAQYQPPDPIPLKEDTIGSENEVRDVGDVQKNLVRAFVEALFVVAKHPINPSLAPVLTDLQALREEESEEEIPITPFAFTTTRIVLSTAFNQIDAPVPMPAISPDSEGGIWVEWIRLGRNVRLVVPSNSSRRSYIFHRVDDVSDIDRISGVKLAELLKTVILTA